MHNKKSKLLLSTAIFLALAGSAQAEIKFKDSNHKISGGFKATYGADSNIGSAPAGLGGAPAADDEQEEFNLDDETGEDALDEIMEDIEQDTEDLSEDDSADLDGDGTLDLIDEADSDVDGDEELDVGSAPGKGTGDGDERVLTAFALKHEYKLDKQITWKSAGNLGFAEQNDRDDLDRKNWAISTGPEFNFKKLGLKINPSVSYLNLSVNGVDQMSSTIASLGSTLKLSKNFALLARYNHEFRDNRKPNATELGVDALRIGAKYTLGKNLFSAAILPKFESNDNSQKDKNRLGYELGYGRKLPWKLQADVAMRYGVTEFSNLAPQREDDDYQYQAKLTKNFPNGLYADVGAVHKRKDSNINSKDTNGSSVFVSAGWKF